MGRKLVVLVFGCVLPLLLCARVFYGTRKAPDFTNDVEWLDQDRKEPHSLKGYRGHVVLIDFWEYTCINCIRDFAVVKRWYTKYHPLGFEVIGVHFGEFEIGHKTANVKRAAERFHLPWPVVSDVSGSIWKAYGSQSWPNRYLIDQNGEIIMEVSGEGNNQEMEAKLRELLAKQHAEAARIALDKDEEAFAPACGFPTQETYVGDWFGRGALENGRYHDGETANFHADHAPAEDGGVVLGGRWTTLHDAVASEAGDDTATLRYHARSAYAVLSLADGKKPVRVYLEQDGAPLKKGDAGVDVRFDEKGAYVEVSAPRMYYLVKNAGSELPLPKHVLTMKPQAKGFMLHSFTYGNNCQQEFEQL